MKVFFDKFVMIMISIPIYNRMMKKYYEKIFIIIGFDFVKY